MKMDVLKCKTVDGIKKELAVYALAYNLTRLAALGEVLHDGDLAEAILDRLLERGAHFAMRGHSYRTRHLKEEERPTRTATMA